MLERINESMKFWIVIFLLTMVCLRGICAGDDFGGSANLTYGSTETKTGEEEESSWGFAQIYNLQATKKFTSKINFAANLGINLNETNNTETTLLTPDIRLNLKNEYFDADTGYRITEKGLDILTMVSDEDRLTTESWNINFSTKSDKYPKVRLRYNEDMNYDRLAVREIDTKTTNFSGSADYTFRFLNFNYDYKNDISDNYVTECTTETDTHDGRINFSKSFWKNKIATSGSYSITNRKTETKTKEQDVKVAEKNTATTESEQTTQTAQANLRYNPTDWLSFTYDFTQDQQKKEETDADSTKTRQSSNNISGRIGKEFQLHRYLNVRPEYQKRLEYNYNSEEKIEDKIIDTYLLHFLSSPLTTLDTDLLLNHTISKEDGETQSKSSSALLHIAAMLREGADLDVDANITRSENPVSQSETTTSSINSNLRLELTRMLTAEIECGMNWTETQQSESGSDTTGRTSNARTTFNWRPSHDFYFRGLYGIARDEKSGEETIQQQYNMSWLMTEKMQLGLGYTLDKNGTVNSTYSSDLSWNLSRIFTLRFNYSRSRKEADTTTETQTFTANLSASF